MNNDPEIITHDPSEWLSVEAHGDATLQSLFSLKEDIMNEAAAGNTQHYDEVRATITALNDAIQTQHAKASVDPLRGPDYRKA